MIYTTAGWVITSKREVLLQQTIQTPNKDTKIICYEPIKGEVFSDESAPNACYRLIVWALNNALSPTYRQIYSLRREPSKGIQELYTTEDEDRTGNKIPATRWHFFYIIAPEWILNYLPSPKFRTLKIGDRETVRNLTEVKKNPPPDLERITVLSDFDHRVLNGLWEPQMVLTPAQW